MELALSLGDSSKPFTASFIDKAPSTSTSKAKDLEFRVGLGINAGEGRGKDVIRGGADSDAVPLQLDLLPFTPVPHSKPLQQFRFPWLAETLGSAEPDSSAGEHSRGLDVNRFPAFAEETDDGGAHSSPNSAVSSFHMEFGISSGSGGRGNKRDLEADAERDGSRGSDDDENGLTRKKLRLSKEQSAFLEESFKEHSTLNPQLNLRPRQVEVWFQNRRARTKLKQTEIDCEYLKRCCETLTEENRRLQKELQELRALKTSQPFYMQLPATTLTMCPSCERVATSSSSAAAAASASSAAANSATTLPLLAKPRVYPFPQAQAQAHKAAS
ncbi:hypothetical protein CDL15_Pgr003143 [Punica granatum]|uniref:Homeobox domain-containing protein n=1 Tax=Punica granatum TaxID=22663 RepID=A0A218X3Q2_PUNGR|nr:hypothetical protein CDL15_Pgr003143 [Punica granatum]